MKMTITFTARWQTAFGGIIKLKRLICSEAMESGRADLQVGRAKLTPMMELSTPIGTISRREQVLTAFRSLAINGIISTEVGCLPTIGCLTKAIGTTSISPES